MKRGSNLSIKIKLGATKAAGKSILAFAYCYIFFGNNKIYDKGVSACHLVSKLTRTACLCHNMLSY